MKTNYHSSIINILISIGFVSGTPSYSSPIHSDPKTEIPGGNNSDSYKKIDDGLYECLYQYTINSVDKTGRKFEEEYYCMLDLGEHASRFNDYMVFRADSAVLTEKTNPKLREKIIFDLIEQKYRYYSDIIQDMSRGIITYTDLLTPGYREYEEPLGKMEWELTNETDTVCGYSCFLATTSYGGREWTAWFAPDIPSQFGPWKFNGLPGLILQVCDTEGVHKFTAVSFRKSSTPIAKPHNRLISKTTREKFIEEKTLFEKNPYTFTPPEGIDGVFVNTRTGEIFINGVEVPHRPNGYTPIELQ